MNKDIIKGNWQQMRCEIKKQWGILTDNDLDIIEGNREKLLGRIQERYGIKREKAEEQMKEFEKKWEDTIAA